MPAKKITKPADASAKLLEMNSDLHQLLAEMVSQQQVEEDVAVLPAAPIVAALETGAEAAKILQAVSPSSPELQNLANLNEAIVFFLGKFPPDEGKVTTTVPVATALNEVIVNDLANSVHNAAMLLVGATKQLKACTVAVLAPIDAFMASKYCSGVLPKLAKQVVVNEVKLKHIDIEGTQKVLFYPTRIDHTLGYHKVIPSISNINGKADMAIEYRESGPGYPGSPNRMKGVDTRLKKEGFECHLGTKKGLKYGQETHLYCWGEVEPDKLRQLATFFSLLRDGDIGALGNASQAGIDTSPVISEMAWEVAQKLNQQYGDGTWESGQGHLDWQQLLNQWNQVKEIYGKEHIYEALKQLALRRDRHHEIEEKYGISGGKKSMEGAKKILTNANEALAILTKNKWPDAGLAKSVGYLDSVISSGTLTNLLEHSDGVGHVMHLALNSILHKQGTYGGCSTMGNIEDINAGTLSYCEGVLKGTSAVPAGGTDVGHNVAPLSYLTFVVDELPGGGYDLHIPLPEHDAWTTSLKNFLSNHKKFDCSTSYAKWPAGQICNIHVKDLDTIRELSLFLSNLRGASNAIGDECIPKALEMADEASKSQNEKGIFAFTQEPIMPQAKAWIDLCHKKYGILPPGLTKEEKQILTMLGAEKLYAGCSFAESDIIPNEGILTYCEGVRKNPQEAQSAWLMPDGQLAHYFHDKMDNIAIVNIIPLSPGKYQVELKNIGLMGANLQSEVVKLLKMAGYNCPNNMECSAEIGPNTLRKLAYFLSSLHQVYKLEDPKCISASVEYAGTKADFAPTDIAAYDHAPVYPWTVAQWNQEVCSKLVPGVPPTLPAVKEAVEEKPFDVPKGAKLHVGGCTLAPGGKPTEVKDAYCEGVIGEYIEGGVTKKQEFFGLFPGTAARLGPFNEHYLAHGLPGIVFDSKWKTLYITLPVELAKIEPVVEALVKQPFNMNKISPQTFKKTAAKPPPIARRARFLSYLSGINTLPESCHQAAVDYAKERAEDPSLSPIYPWSTEDWLKDVCGEKPPEEKPIDPEAVLNAPWDYSDVLAIKKIWDILPSQVTQCMAQKMEKPGGYAPVTLLPEGLHGKTPEQVKQLWAECVAEYKAKQVIEKPYYSSLPEDVQQGIIYFIKGKVKAGADKFEIEKAIIDNWGISSVGLPQVIALTTEEVQVEGLPPTLEELIKKSETAMKNSYGKIPLDQLKKAKETKEYKKLPKAVKDWLHNVMNYYLLSGHKTKSDPDYPQQQLLKVLELNQIPITPLMVKLQLDIEKKKKIRRGELPPEPGEEVVLVYEDLNKSEHGEIYDEIVGLAKEGKTGHEIADQVTKNWGIAQSIELTKLIGSVVSMAPKEEEVEGKFTIHAGPSISDVDKVGEAATEYEAMKKALSLKDAYVYIYVWDWGKMEKVWDSTEAEKPPEKQIIPKGELLQWLQSYLIAHPGNKYTPAYLHTILEAHTEYTSPGIIPVGDTLVKLADAGQISVDKKVMPYLFWYEKKAETYYDLPQEQQITIMAQIEHWLKEKTPEEQIKASITAEWFISEKGLDAVIKTVKSLLPPPVSEVAEAIQMIKAGKPYGGCHPDQPGIELNAPLIAYCEGIMTPPGKTKAGFVGMPTKEVAYLLGMPKKMPIVGQHSDGYSAQVTAQEEHVSHTLDLLFRDIEKKGKQWKVRQDAVATTLTEELGYTCAFLDDSVTCKRTGGGGAESKLMEADKDAIRTTALFMSGLSNIDKLEAGCVKPAVKFALDAAKQLVPVWMNPWEAKPYPYYVPQWNKEVCDKLPEKPVRLEASTLAKALGTVGLLDAAHSMGVSPAGSDESLAKKLLDAGYEGGA